tara:strand:+ start:2838 stop:3086 length:249 start_codon:yes stop_codon:yes gene_type:complete
MGAEWVGALGIVAAAVVTGLFGLILSRFRRENTDQHASTTQALGRLENKMDVVSEDVVGLTVWSRVHDEKHRLIEERDRGGA